MRPLLLEMSKREGIKSRNGVIGGNLRLSDEDE